jgi:hypothetical protein
MPAALLSAARYQYKYFKCTVKRKRKDAMQRQYQCVDGNCTLPAFTPRRTKRGGGNAPAAAWLARLDRFDRAG